MSREQERIRKKLENNPIAECNKIQNRFCPELFSMFGRVKDPRNQSYIDYSSRVMLGTMYYKSIAGISSMQEMTRTFNDEKICRNLYRFMGEEVKDYMPHGVTENEFLERLDPRELENVQQNIVYSMIRRKTFDNAKVLKKWQIIVDATELDEGYQKKNEHYLSRCYNRGSDKEYIKYHRSILEAKIYFGENLVCSIASETIENSEKYINQSDEAVKQDCESKAFVRLAAKIKQKFPRLPIIITADGLYVTKTVLQICKDYHWDYIIRYKEGCASSIAKEYRALPEKETIGTDIEYQNKIMFNDFDVNLIYYRERWIVKGEEKEREFAWITSIEITKSNAKKIVRAGRNRWKIENQGFNRQKHWQGDIEHACSWNERAQKNHYLMEQIADFVKQLYEYFYLEKNGIKKLQKNISPELLASFGRQLTETEDIPVQLNNSVQN
ncbi:transposase family protein [Roseburia sp. 499]|uniref:transposase family protein n=2 Tax=Roseburia sp. 499 TaxID=1261634 RepID=UPI00095227BE|nr:transposase family protein [Roseburia sp. 499]WVK68531.1 transposase [Roseburia sp. 499]WVK68912.1 transposase [Roseburia sp. 499]WVK68934.1 transposase [Roseburia sp. 499]WVK69608.1 transposase [Roseburia sp. 499]WVK70360.1 transposase [Roseburia sp. 499]